MVLDIESFRPTDDPDALGPDGVRKIMADRFKDVSIVDKVIEVDEKWRVARYQADEARRVKNLCSKVIKDKFKAKEAPGDADEPLPEAIVKAIMETKAEVAAGLTINQLKKLSKLTDETKVQVLASADEMEAVRNNLLRSVGNVLADDVPRFADEEHNKVEKVVGDAGPEFRQKYSHVDLIEMIGGVDMERGSVTAGNRGYYLRGPGVALELALVLYAQKFMTSREYTALSPPVFMRKEVMNEVAQLSQFDEELYKVTGRASEDETVKETKEYYLIATAEQPIAAYHRDEWMDPAILPIRYMGVSECFRQEVGSRGRDTRGIFRVHQFKKVEQFTITSPDKSWEMMTEMLTNSEDFLQSLGLPYQVINIVSGALNLAAAKKLDIEAWFPGSGAFRELVSCSNCTDYQSRRLKVRFGQTRKQNEKLRHVHMLNSTLCATTRTICCILENFQVGDFGDEIAGIVVPEVLRPYMPPKYEEFIPFVRDAPKAEEDARKEKIKKATAKKKEGKK